ncbi:RecA-like recombination protein [Morganella phage vB_Mm5]
MSKLLSKYLKTTKLETAVVMSKSESINNRDFAQTRVPMINLALSGSFRGGLSSGITIFAGPSKHFKTCFGLVMVSAYMRKYPDAVCIFYDNERGLTPSYMAAWGVDPDRTIHIRTKNIEEIKTDMAKKLDAGVKGEHVIYFIDSIGNAASNKEIEDAVKGESKADMQRAKEIKSFFRIISPFITELDIPCVAIAHTYKTMEMYSKDVIGGGTGVMYNCDSAFIIGKRQNKDDKTKELLGYEFVLRVAKSRYIKEGVEFPVSVTYDEGIDNYTGLFDMAKDLGFVGKMIKDDGKESRDYYQRKLLDPETGELVAISTDQWKVVETSCVDFWKPLFLHQPFIDAVEAKYKLSEKINVKSDIDGLLQEQVGDDLSDEIPMMKVDDTEQDEITEE